jgi:N-acyl-D-amino-acid deacylase
LRIAPLCDGTGNPWFYWRRGRARRPDRRRRAGPGGKIAPEQASSLVDARGMVVCPGFIDIQSHSILTLMADGRSLSKIAQGVTTEIMGEAWTPAPFGGQIADPLAGALFVHDTWRLAGARARVAALRRLAGGRGGQRRLAQHRLVSRRRHAAPVWLRHAHGPGHARRAGTMRRVMAEAMEDGAFGVSYALIYPPDSFVDTDELVAICQVVAQHHGVYITHVRSEAELLVESIGEAIEIGRRAKLPVEIYHLKAAGRPNWRLMPAAIAAIERRAPQGWM